MKANFLLRWRFGLLLLAVLGGPKMARAQTIDPSFQATSVFKPAALDQVLQQPDGKRLVMGGMLAALSYGVSTRAGNQPAGKLVRLLANSNEPDSVFTYNVRGLQGTLLFMVVMPSGQIVLASYGTISLGSVTRQSLLRLNADGTPDASFDANLPVSTYNSIVNAVGQPDGKLVLVCRTSIIAGISRLLRLQPNGSLDTAFQSAVNSLLPFSARLGTNVTLQPDGKLLVPGTAGLHELVRLLPTGALDATFNSQAALPTTALVDQVALQPDGKVLVALSRPGTSSLPPLIRLTATGAADPTFQVGLTGYFGTAFPPAAELQVQADGKLLVYNQNMSINGTAVGPLFRLLPGGSLDTSFMPAAALGIAAPLGTQLLPSGQILIVKSVDIINGAPACRLILLNPNGSRDTSFEPRVYVNGQINDVVQLPNGGYLVGGDFTEINGMSAGYLARLSAAGVPDPTFTVTADDEVRSLLVQPDSKLVVSGRFEHIASGNRVALARLLPSGALDTSFAPPFLPAIRLPKVAIGRVALLPDGRVLAAGTTRLTSAATPETWLRVLDGTTGQPDLSIPNYTADDMVIQPNGKVVVAGYSSPNSTAAGYCVFRLLPGGALDPTFTSLPTSRTPYGGGPFVTALAQSASGSLYLTGYYTSDSAPPPPARLYSLNPDGQALSSIPSTQFRQVLSLAAQPNGQLLVGTDIWNAPAAFGLSRVLSTLAPDPSFNSANGPLATVNRLMVQPDGAIMGAGSFTSAGGQAIAGLVRLLDSNVLSVSSRQLAASTQAWPVPAHGTLHLALDAASRPQRVELLDALGRVALSRATPQAELTLDTSPLKAGVYVLRVQYASGPVARRVVVE